MKYLLIFTCILFVLVGCKNTKIENKKTIVVDGHSYIFIRAAHTNSNGLVDAELWEKVGVTNRYYTPSLTGKSMMSLMR